MSKKSKIEALLAKAESTTAVHPWGGDGPSVTLRRPTYRQRKQSDAMSMKMLGTVGQAAEFAKQSPEPDVAELYTDILVSG